MHSRLDFQDGNGQETSRAAGAPQSAATGTFSAVTSLAGIPLITVAGPVTCVDVVGNRVGLFYPVQSSSPALLSTPWDTRGGGP